MWISANLASGVSKKLASLSRLRAEGLRASPAGTQCHAAAPNLQPGVQAHVGPPVTAPLFPRQSDRAPSSSSIPRTRVSPCCTHATARCRELKRWPEMYSQPHRPKPAGAGQIPGLATLSLPPPLQPQVSRKGHGWERVPGPPLHSPVSAHSIPSHGTPLCKSRPLGSSALAGNAWQVKTWEVQGRIPPTACLPSL